MADESVKAAFDFALKTPDYSISLKIDSSILAGIVSVGALSLGAYYLANKQSSERAIRDALEARNQAGVVDPEVRNIEQGSILVGLHCHSEKSFLNFLKDFEAEKVRNRLQEQFTKIGFQGNLNVMIRNADEVKRRVTEMRLSLESRNMNKGEDKGIQEAAVMPITDARSAVYPMISNQEETHTSTKRTAAEASTGEHVEKSASKRRKLEEVWESGSDNEATSGNLIADVVFAVDYSSSVSEEDLEKEINFVKHLAKSWNVPSAELIVYGDDSPIVIPLHSELPFSEVLGVLTRETLPQSKYRRIDLALTKAAKILPAVVPGSQNQDQLVVLISAGKQTSSEKSNDENDLLVSASEELYSKNIKVIIVPVGLETDFKELGLIVKRPQCLFPHSSFDDLTDARAQEIAVHIRETIDIDVYTKRKLHTFTGIPTQSPLWEQISLCSDVMEGAWYLLYDDHKKPNRPEKIKKLIRESIDNFHNKLVSDSKICISLAVFGPQGAGKSFFLNFLLNQGLSKVNQGKDGPLPSGIGDSQTPLPISVKYGSKVQVLLHRQDKGMHPVVWFAAEELGIDTLTQVSQLLKMKFQDGENLIDAKYIELQGPFPVFRSLQEGLRIMTKSGHLELEVDVEFVDVPGRGAIIGNESINIELSKADVVLFFQEGRAGRPVSAEDIAQIFRRREEFQFTSRPKLVHVVNDEREQSSLSSCNFELLQQKKKEDLDKAWSTFFSSSSEDRSASGCYSDVRKRLPQLYGEALLDRLSKESDVVYFHPANSGFLESLKYVIAAHVHNVKIKEAIHPFLQDVHWAAKKLRGRIGKSLTTEIKKSEGRDEDTVSVPFEMHCSDDELNDLARGFVDETSLPLQLHTDTEDAHPTFYHDVLNSEKTVIFLKDSLEASLGNFVNRLIAACNAANWATSQDFNELVEVLCRNRVQQFCENSARTYLLHILRKVKIPKQRGKYKKLWPSASAEKKKEICVDIVYNLLKQTVDSLMNLKGKRDNQYKKSHFHLRERLIQDVNELLHVKCSHDDSKANVLKMLHGKLQIVIQFCTKSIREINPHPSLDVKKDTTLPEEMTAANTANKPIPLESSHKQIIQDIANLLQPTKGKKTDCVRALERKLNLGKGALALPQSQSAEEQHLWEKALVSVLSDKDHFDTPLPPSLTLDPGDPKIKELLKLARKRLFAHQKSCVSCKIVTDQAVPDNELHVKKPSQDENSLEVRVSPKMCDNLDSIRDLFVDPMQQIAPIFIPTIRPGPTADIRGNFFLEEDPWSRDEDTDDLIDEQDETVTQGEVKENKVSVLDLNIFLVVEEQHLKTLQSTVDGLKAPAGRNMMYVVLPQKGRGIGVTRGIIKGLAEYLNVSLYWTIDDDVQYMYQFDENDRKWHKCSLARGLLFGQRVFQTCLKKTVRELPEDEVFNFAMNQKFPEYASKTKQSATYLLLDSVRFAQVLKNPGLLHSPFAHIPEDCRGDSAREEEMKAFEQQFVDKCTKLLFDDSINHIAGVSIAHESTKRYDYMSKYPTADYMQSEQRYQVVLNNTPALKGMNFVTDDIIFHGDEDQVKDNNKRNTPYWGVKGSDRSFCRALTVSGVIGYQVIRVVHSHKKLINVFDRVGPSYIRSQSPYRSEDEDEEDQDVN